ncbi:E3 ubiquitin-protein ligase RNF25-like [Elysia marginata]|uniref:E3 ubiquitin-protein ligase RNF25-like n=1 Tax=Elysia marginata TaxID=1093978 RepID=A0AAV4F4Q7_9GAST|nr:E3 ubiquitin-protein ligase RNF25-like [Elysia marginata]
MQRPGKSGKGAFSRNFTIKRVRLFLLITFTSDYNKIRRSSRLKTLTVIKERGWNALSHILLFTCGSAKQDPSAVETELESLEAIYIEELSYKRKADGSVDTIELLLHPATGDERDKQFVCMTLVFTPSPKYPDEIPSIEIKNPRGLGEEEIASLIEDMISKAHECVGEVMMFTLIEVETICCPVCRAPLGEESLSFTTDESEEDQQEEAEAFVLPPDLKEQQAKMAELFARQKAKGGIIDLEQEKNKYLVNANEHRPATTTSPIPPNSPIKSEGPLNKGLGDVKPHQRNYRGVDFRGGKRGRNERAQGRGRGHDHQHREKNNDHHYHHQDRSRNHHHHHYDQYESGHSQGGGKPRYGGSANRGSYHQDGDASSNGRQASSAAKAAYRDDVLPLRGASVAKAFHTEQVNKQSSSFSYETTSSMQNSRHFEDGGGQSSIINSTHEERKGGKTPHWKQRSARGNRGEGGGFGRRPRGRGGSFNVERKYDVSKQDVERDIEREVHENRTAFSDLPETRGISAENDQDKVEVDQSTYKRGRGRGRFRDFDRAYFENKTCVTDDPDNCDNPSKARRDPATSRRGGGCRERHKQNHWRDNEYDDTGDGNYRYTRQSARSGQGQRVDERSYTKSGSGGQSSRHAGSSNDGQSRENHKGGTYNNNSLKDGDQISNHGSDTEAQKELEMNRKWRKMNFGYNTSGEHKTASGFKVIDDDDNGRDERRDSEEQCIKNYGDRKTPSSSGLFVPDSTTCQPSPNLNMYYVGYGEDEEEEDWDKESFPYAFERSYIRTEHLQEYDKFRKKDYEISAKIVEERANRERLLLEEDRRMRREQAEMERKRATFVTESQPAAKSVLEVFQEKQEAKRKEAERLKREQQMQTEGHEKKRTESLSDEAFHSDDQSASSSSTTSKTGSVASLSSSSQGYRSQSSAEEFSQEDASTEAAAAQSQPHTGMKEEKDAYGQASCEIVWVGVKKKPDPGPPCLSVDESSDLMKPGPYDPCLDAWERREQVKRNQRTRSNMEKGKVETCSVESPGVSRTETNMTNEGFTPSATTEVQSKRMDGKVHTGNLLSKSQSDESTPARSSVELKQKTFTKAPPLNLLKRNKHKPCAAPSVGCSSSGLPDLTKSEVAQLKALYMKDEETPSEDVGAPQVHQVYTRTENSFESKSSSRHTLDKQEPDVEVGNPQIDMAALTVDSAISSHQRTSCNKENRSVERKNPSSQASSKPLKKAPPLNLKKISTKPPKSCAAGASTSSEAFQGGEAQHNTRHKDISKVMKYLGIELDNENSTFTS